MNIIVILGLIDKQQNQIFPNQQQNPLNNLKVQQWSSVDALMAMRVASARELSRKSSKKNHGNCLDISQRRSSSKDMQEWWSSFNSHLKWRSTVSTVVLISLITKMVNTSWGLLQGKVMVKFYSWDFLSLPNVVYRLRRMQCQNVDFCPAS